MNDQNIEFDSPDFFQNFKKRFPELALKYEALGNEVHENGPLDERTRALIKLAVSGSAGLESAFRTHILKAKKLGITREEIEHVALLFLPTLGFPAMMKALHLVDKNLK